ncbi:CPBP family intramembrane metalloprotease [bacterium]|nr:CPBP family intramembrane metalloprotease [bacterium]
MQESPATDPGIEAIIFRRNDARVPGFWNTAAISSVALLFAILCTLIVHFATTALFADHFFHPPDDAIARGYFALVAVLIFFPIVAGVCLSFLRLWTDAPWRDVFATGPARERRVWRWFWIFGAFYAVVAVAATVLERSPPDIEEIFGNVASWPLVFLGVVVIAPVFEELFFRGFLFSGLAESRVGNKGAVFGTALFFALMHTQYDWFFMAVLFGVGLILALARLDSGSVRVPIALHVAMNGAALAVSYLK